MTKLEQIEKAIASLTRDEISKLAAWFGEFHAEAWDRQIEEDAASGRLDKFAAEALESHKSGRSRPL